MAAFAGPLPAEKAGHNRRKQRHGRRMVAHPRQRARRRRTRSGLHQVHQPGSRPKRRRVESGAPRFRSLLAESGDRRIDDPLIDRADIVVADVQTFASRYRHIGNKHIGGLDEAFESRPPRLSFNV